MTRAEDIEDIRTATHRYCLGLDARNVEAALSVFTADAVLDHRPLGYALSTGHQELRTYFAQLHEQMPAMAHLLSNHVVEFTSADTADGVNYVYAEATAADGTAIKALAKNTDSYRRTSDGWMIEHRVTTGLI
jgi:ketosteroid isomerase-like protein